MVPHMTESVAADRWHFKKDPQTGVASESVDECSVFQINVILLNPVFPFRL